MSEHTCEELKNLRDDAKSRHGKAASAFNTAESAYNTATAAVTAAETKLRDQQSLDPYPGQDRDIAQKQEAVDAAWEERRNTFATKEAAEEAQKTASEAFENWSKAYDDQCG